MQNLSWNFGVTISFTLSEAFFNIFVILKKSLQDNYKSAHSEFYRNDCLWWAWYTVKKFKNLKIHFLNGQGLKVYILFFNPCLLFYCCLVNLPRKPFKIPLMWYIYHLSRSHRSWDMNDWPIWVSAFRSKFTDPYFGLGMLSEIRIVELRRHHTNVESQI